MDAVVRILAAGVMTAAIGGATGAPEPGAPAVMPVRAAALGMPLPRDPAPNPPSSLELPTPDQLTALLSELVDPDVPDQAKNSLVQGGIGSGERRAFKHDRLAKAADHGELPLSFGVENIWWVGPATAAAHTVVSGPKMAAPVVKVLTFVDQNGWMLSSDSAAALIETVTGS